METTSPDLMAGNMLPPRTRNRTAPYLSQRVRDQRRPGRQEFFLTALHAPMVGLVLPHASAIVSNSCSLANDGFSSRLSRAGVRLREGIGGISSGLAG